MISFELSENQKNWFEKFVMQDRNTEMFAIVELENNQLMGACGLCYIDWINRNADFSIYIVHQTVTDLYQSRKSTSAYSYSGSYQSDADA